MIKKKQNKALNIIDPKFDTEVDREFREAGFTIRRTFMNNKLVVIQYIEKGEQGTGMGYRFNVETKLIDSITINDIKPKTLELLYKKSVELGWIQEGK